MNNTIHITEDSRESKIEEFLMNEFGECYRDTIEMEWNLSVEGFCRKYIKFTNKKKDCICLV